MSNQTKQTAVDLLKVLETGDSKPYSNINPSKYIQHNLGVADGLRGLDELLRRIPPDSVTVKTVRVFQDDDYVFVHSIYGFLGPTIVFDIFRFEDGQAVEHWDNVQGVAPANPSGHSMIDGPTESKDHDKTADNKALVRGFVEAILVNGKLEKLAGYFDGDNYTQHNPHIGDGLSGKVSALEARAKQGITVKYDKIHMVLGEGDFVLVVSEGDFAGQPTSFYDLFRVAGGKIAEHWDTLETILPQREWKNSNGKF